MGADLRLHNPLQSAKPKGAHKALGQSSWHRLGQLGADAARGRSIFNLRVVSRALALLLLPGRGAWVGTPTPWSLAALVFS